MVKDPLKDLGASIKARRSELSWSIERLSKESRVSAKHIENIEEANRADLPESAYLIGFLALILKTLDFDHDKMVEEFKEEDSNYIVQQIVDESDAIIEREKSKKFAVTADYFKVYHLYIFALIVILALGFTMMRKSTNSGTEKVVVSEQVQVTEEVTSPEEDKIAEEVENQQEEEALEDSEAKEKALKEAKEAEEKAKKEAKEAEEKAEKEREKLEKERLEKEKEEKKRLEEERKRLEEENKLRKLSNGRGRKELVMKVTDLAWVQITAIDQDEVLFEGDVYPNAGPNELHFNDDTGFIIATGNAGAFQYSLEGSDFIKLGEKGQLLKRYLPLESREIYLQREQKSFVNENNTASFEKIEGEEYNSNGSIL